MTFLIKKCILIFNLLLVLTIVGFAQEQPTPTPVGIISIQGNDNTGRIQPLSMEEIITRTGILTWQQANWTGRDQRVGVIDQGFGGILAFEGANGITVTFLPGSDKTEMDTGFITHGTDVLTVIHSIAPNAQFYACAYGDLDRLVSCIDWMLASDVNIINHSVGVPALPLDGTGQWAREVDRVVRDGVLWVNAAGNFANGYISDFFNDNNLNTYHEFRGSGIIETLAINSINQNSGRVMLSWEGAGNLTANEIDLDLEIIDVGQQVIAVSANPQRGNSSESALEIVQVDMSQPFGVRVRNSDDNGSQVHFVLFIEFASLPSGLTQQSVISPGDSINALTVGALQGNTIAPYSSRGPIATGAIKPDVAAPGELLLANGRVFVGTSAAAAVVTGIAALVWEANPDWTQPQVYQFMLQSVQDDRDIPGADSNYGQGRVYLPDIWTSLTPVTQTVPLTQSYESPEGISFLYPDGWVVRDNSEGSTILIANTEEALEGFQSPEQAGIVIMYPSISNSFFSGSAEEQLLHFVDFISSLEGSEVGTIEAISLGDYQAYEVNTTRTDSGDFFIAIDLEDGIVVLVAGTTYDRENLAAFKPTMMQIIETIRYRS